MSHCPYPPLFRLPGPRLRGDKLQPGSSVFQVFRLCIPCLHAYLPPLFRKNRTYPKLWGGVTGGLLRRLTGPFSPAPSLRNAKRCISQMPTPLVVDDGCCRFVAGGYVHKDQNVFPFPVFLQFSRFHASSLFLPLSPSLFLIPLSPYPLISLSPFLPLSLSPSLPPVTSPFAAPGRVSYDPGRSSRGCLWSAAAGRSVPQGSGLWRSRR